MPAIYIDLDDVVSESTRTYVDIVKQEFGRDIPYEQITMFDLKECFGLTQAEFDYFFDKVHQADVLLSFKPITGAIDVLKSWSDTGYEICIVTGRLAHTYDASLQWLTTHEVPFHTLTMVDKYARLNVDNRKAVSLDRLSRMVFCLAVEDSPDMAHFLCRTMSTPVALFDRPWNRSVEPNSILSRFETWKHIGSVHRRP
jgi:uncharacterized HAD superfamily protein